MNDKLREYATQDLDWNTRKLDYFKKEYDEIKDLKDPKSLKLQYIIKIDMNRTVRQIAYIKCFLNDDPAKRDEIEVEMYNTLEELRNTFKINTVEELRNALRNS